VVFVNAHSYYAAVTANYLMIECDKFCKVVCCWNRSFHWIISYMQLIFRFKLILIYPIVFNVLVPMVNGVRIWVNIFVVHLNVWNIIVQHVGIWIHTIWMHQQQQQQQMNVNHQLWYTNHWCEMLEQHKSIDSLFFVVIYQW